MRKNSRTNRLIMWLVIALDFVLLNTILYAFSELVDRMGSWSYMQMGIFIQLSNVALLISEWKFHTTIQERVVSAGDVLKLLSQLTITQTVIAYALMRHWLYTFSIGRLLIMIGTVFFMSLVILRLIERSIIKRMRRMGRNTRTVTFVGNDKELKRVYDQLISNPTLGYRMHGYFADKELKGTGIPWLGTLKGLMEAMDQGLVVKLGDELYVSLSKRERETIERLSAMCDHQVTKFYYIPRAVDTLGLDLKREFINDIEVFTTHESPLDSVVNQAVKRVFDIAIALVVIVLTALIFPIIYVIIKRQSPGPIYFKQLRTGLDGKDFVCYKFRSMHVNKDADKLQATKDDPRKYPFGNFMRKANIDELPQFWNVLKGDMSVVGPRPHMLAHTEMYSQKIGDYMVRHFVKPGITGWAQVTGFRGETHELWQMEERVKRDIWYMEHWSIWLDIRIIWMTIKTCFVHDKNAY